MRSVCTVDECTSIVKGRGLCGKHYQQARDLALFDKGCAACGRVGSRPPLCIDCQPMVCVCVSPSPDAIGECQLCRRVYRPNHRALMECRDAWIAYLDAHGVTRQRVLPEAS